MMGFIVHVKDMDRINKRRLKITYSEYEFLLQIER